MKKVLFILLSLILISCSKDDDKIDSSQFIGDYELKSCFDDTKHFPNALGGCEITNDNGKVKLEMRVEKNADESISFVGYVSGNIIKGPNGDKFGEIVCGSSFWIYQTNGVVYEFLPNYVGSEKPEISSGRCIATTKKGTRCKRKADKGSVYCWQHKYNH